MQYVFSMTTRMVTIVLICATALCVLLFLLGIEIGVRYMAPAKAPSMASSTAPLAPAAMVEPAPIAADAGSESVVRSASDPAGAPPAPASSNN